MSAHRIFAFLAAALSSVSGEATDHFLLVGGGPIPLRSQVSIEKNALWIDQLMRERTFATYEVLFAAGPAGPPDVMQRATLNPVGQQWLPIARVYGQQMEAMAVFRRNEMPNNTGAASLAGVESALQTAVARLGRGDTLFLVYSGHGSFDSDTSRNTLRLWGESNLDVRRFSDLMNTVRQDATVRFVLPQCYSGAFLRSIARDPANPDSDAVLTNRCGFVAVSDNMESEGCTPGVDAAEYRDYLTYFFAALAGRQRTGERLRRDPDVDGDGRVTLAEAHGYAYTEGLSTDVPRSTSEYYLELWEPWQVRWHSAVPIDGRNPYADWARRLAENLGLPEQGLHAWARGTLHARRDLTGRKAALEAELLRFKAEEETLRAAIRKDFEREWPNATQPRGGAYAQFVGKELGPAAAWILRHRSYAQLARLQDRIEQQELMGLELRRLIAQHARLHRAVRLATTLEHFRRLASESERAAFESLTQCEGWGPGDATSGR